MAAEYGVKTTWPLGTKVAPLKELVGIPESNVDADKPLGSTIAIDVPPVYTIFPDDKSVPPPIPEAMVVVLPNVESARVDGLKEATDETLLEKSITFPFGARTGDWRLAARIFEKVGGILVVLYIHTFPVPPMTTFPFGSRTPPIPPKTPVVDRLE